MKTQRIQNPVGEMDSHNGSRLIKRLYTVKEAAVYLGRSEWAIREMYYAGKIPCVHDGSRVLLDIRDLDSWIERSKEQLTY
jgi:excisionase family DNA binding protein